MPEPEKKNEGLDAEGWYPPPAFFFSVSFDSSGGQEYVSFQEVSGISTELATETIREGGENRFVHELPTGLKYGKLQLKRGIALKNDPFVVWCKAVLEGDFSRPVAPKTITVMLMGPEGDALRVWDFYRAYPVKWEVEGFGSTKNEVAMEKITFNYATSKRNM